MKIDPTKYKIDTSNTTEWRELGKELTAHFKRNCFWLPYRYPMWKIREALKIAKELDRPFPYFLGILNKK